jgi:hypothetical protein
MGQAKSRGTFEQRLAMAVERNQKIDGRIAGSHELMQMKRKIGTQSLATRLVMAGLMAASLPAPRP